MQNRQLLFSPRKPYDLVAERSEATASCLQFPVWWTCGESNPGLNHAMIPCYRYTTGPSLDWKNTIKMLSYQDK